MGFPSHLDLPRLDAGHLDRFADQKVHSIGFLVDDGQQFLDIGVSGGIGKQCRDRCFDGRQGCLELVRDGVEQGRLELLVLACGFGLAQQSAAASPLEGDRRQVRNGVETGFRDRRPLDTECPRSARPS